jgi:hypothetical protein
VAAKKDLKKAIPIVVVKKEDEENKDPCFGKPKEFFMVFGSD